ncbi:MAG: glycoside hydrolase family 3 C-terminal domain-containing protein [Lachnospiraceae bacterium]|nr:glycoside hydrolase family 3 C-terminal domain-containing protein [Lachnospiraceae bacterium]
MSNKLTAEQMKVFTNKSREAAVEGAVLIKNEDKVLPILSNEKVSVFGRPLIDYYRSGTGSGGAVNVEYATNILDGLKQDGINYNKEITEAYKEWLKDHPFDNGGGGWACEPWFQRDMPITEEMAQKAAAESDKAIYVIGRTAGEDKDNAVWEGSYILTGEEKANIKSITDAFENVIIVLNVSNIIDISWIDAPEYNGHIKSVLFVWAGGMEGGCAVADVISGKVTPSGKLPDTIAYSIEDYPAANNFGNELDNYYEEDIYVGYRYFETFCPDKVQYEFGFGISYTTFDYEVVEAKADEKEISVSVKVTNTGDEYSGKEVIQVYYGAPQGALGKPAKELAAFAKTGVLAPGASEVLTISFPVKQMESYDDSGVTGNKSCYVLEAGEYEIFAGNSVKNVTKVTFADGSKAADGSEITDGKYITKELVVTEKLVEVMGPIDDLKIMKPGAKKADGTYELTYIEASKSTVDMAKRINDALPEAMEITGDQGITLQDVRDGKATLDAFVAQLTVEEMAILVRGEGMSNPRVTSGTASAFGGMCDSLFNYGVPAACCADGPSGLRMEAKSVQLPIGTLLAASWNVPLVQELYTMEGQALLANEVDTLLGPGANVHRHPLNGRNFEYYSEDPYLTGVMATATCLGLKEGGGWGTIKHFACNGQEAHRFKINAVASERAIREIYLKAFEMAVKADSIRSIMTSYNPINGHWSASNYDLNTVVLREEWGFKGIVMTDWWARMNDVVDRGEETREDTRDMIRSQNDVYMVVNNNGAEINSLGDNTEESIANGRLTIGELQRTAKNICSFLLESGCIHRELIDPDVAVSYAPAAEATCEVQKLADDNKVKIGTDVVSASFEVDEEAEYSIIVNIMSPFSNLAQSTCNVSLNGETAFIIQTNGTDGNWNLQKLVKVKLEKGIYNIGLEHVLAGLNVDYIQFKKVPKKVKK